MEHCAIEFKDGAQSSVQEEIRNMRKLQRDERQYQLAIKDKPTATQGVQPAQIYRKDQPEFKEPVIKDE